MLTGAAVGAAAFGAAMALGPTVFQAQLFGKALGGAGLSGWWSLAFGGGTLVVFGLSWLSFFIVGFTAYATAGAGLLIMSHALGRFSLGFWIIVFLALSSLTHIAVFDDGSSTSVISFTFILLWQAASVVGLVLFWRYGDPEGLQQLAVMQREGLVGDGDKPADWAIAAARRIAEKD